MLFNVLHALLGNAITSDQELDPQRLSNVTPESVMMATQKR